MRALSATLAAFATLDGDAGRTSEYRVVFGAPDLAALRAALDGAT